MHTKAKPSAEIRKLADQITTGIDDKRAQAVDWAKAENNVYRLGRLIQRIKKELRRHAERGRMLYDQHQHGSGRRYSAREKSSPLAEVSPPAPSFRPCSQASRPKA